MPSEGNVIDQYYIEGQLQAKFGDHLDGWVKASVAGWNNGGGGPGARGDLHHRPDQHDRVRARALFVNPGYACARRG